MEIIMKHPERPDKLPSMQNTAQHRILPPVKTNLENYFQGSILYYSEHEIDQILKRYRKDFDYVTDNVRAIIEKIITILHATKSFLMGTSLDEYSKSLRDEANDENAMITVLADMHKALLIAQEQLKNKDKNTDLQLTYTQAVDYCKKCITYRISELKKVNDKVYMLYQNHQLREFFEPKKFTPQRK